MRTKFTKDFLFGSATSSHQVEGSQNNDWSEWEKVPGHISDGSNSQLACDSWNNWREDIGLLKKTGQNAYRFSLEWSKIEPDEGKFDEEAIKHYAQILKELRREGIVSMVTLFHFTLPLWLSKKEGFVNSESPVLFARFAKKLAESFGDLVDLWATLNEPKVYILKGYFEGEWVPGEKNLIHLVKAYRNLNKAHILAYKELKKVVKTPVGIVENISAYEAGSTTLLNKWVVNLAKYFDTTIFVKPILKYTDFLGINYYMKFRLLAHKPWVERGVGEINDYGWPINQEGLYQVIMENSCWKKPIYITENGIPDDADRLRPDFLRQAFESMSKALGDGADLRGYFYWSLLDNFEWAAGYSMKFGLFTRDRKPRKSASEYARLVKGSQTE